MNKIKFLRFLHEPLVHFLLIGAALFVLYGLQNDGIVDTTQRIVISEADIERLHVLWQKKRQRPPTALELDGLIEHKIREEVLYREAVALGLDKNDSIVRRRLAQKIEFISADLFTQVEPDDMQLSSYLTTHPKQFRIPGRLDFVQVYFNNDKRGEKVKQDALQGLTRLEQLDAKFEFGNIGDPFMLGQTHAQLTEHGVSRLFGQDFAKDIFALPVGSWQGPIASGFGLHLVRIDHKTNSLLPELDSIRTKVREEWLTSQRRTLNAEFYKSLRQRYDIVIENGKARESVAKVDSKLAH